MTRPLSIYPSAGYLFAQPNLPDPLILGPWTVTIPYLDKFNNLAFRDVEMAAMYDDNVSGGGGVCFNLANSLEIMWKQLKAEFNDRNAYNTTPVVDGTLLTPGYNIIAVPNIAYVSVQILQAWKGTDYWYKTNDFAKYGFLTFTGQFGNPTAQQWWNFPSQDFANPKGGSNQVEIFLNGPDSLGLVTAYQTAFPPNITFSGFLNINGFYNDDGMTLT